MNCRKCGYNMEPWDAECPKCHGKGVMPRATKVEVKNARAGEACEGCGRSLGIWDRIRERKYCKECEQQRRSEEQRQRSEELHQRELARQQSLNLLAQGHLQEIQVPLLLKKNEVAYFASVASLLEEKVVRREYVGGYSGFSVRVARGLSYRVGSSKGYSVPVTDIVEVDRGNFYITNQRCVFDGAARSLIVLHTKLLSFQLYRDGIQLHSDRRTKCQFIKGLDGEYAGAVLAGVLRRYVTS